MVPSAAVMTVHHSAAGDLVVYGTGDAGVPLLSITTVWLVLRDAAGRRAGGAAGGGGAGHSTYDTAITHELVLATAFRDEFDFYALIFCSPWSPTPRAPLQGMYWPSVKHVHRVCAPLLVVTYRQSEKGQLVSGRSGGGRECVPHDCRAAHVRRCHGLGAGSCTVREVNSKP
jgi:hypothetical protein